MAGDDRIGDFQAEVLDLQRQLQQAQEERDRLQEEFSTAMIDRDCRVERYEAERDAAIKWGEYLYRQLGAYCAVLFAPDERLEAAEALARRQANGLQWAWYALILGERIPEHQYFWWMKLLNVLIGPCAEALRAEHRSPQGGQAQQEKNSDARH